MAKNPFMVTNYAGTDKASNVVCFVLVIPVHGSILVCSNCSRNHIVTANSGKNNPYP